MFYKSQLEVSKVINELIDGYWNDEISEELLIKNTKKLIEYNKPKIIKNGDYTTVLKQKCGKRRLGVLSKILEIIESR
ncbi:TIGR04540 family protein [Dethiothermospora halolimnae]|uniref:TIGR04540 family protein n=1 Tax=Dethiothermospora halolimnae TaxID=3114390 RepID=UPI003CCBDC2E